METGDLSDKRDMMGSSNNGQASLIHFIFSEGVLYPALSRAWAAAENKVVPSLSPVR